MNYTNELYSRFKGLEINLVVHDTSQYGLPCYIEVHLERSVSKQDRGALVLDLGNYIYRVLGLRYQMTPEFRGRGKSTTLRWFCSWQDITAIRENILKAFGKEKMLRHEFYLPFEFRSLIIQNPRRGVCAPAPKEVA